MPKDKIKAMLGQLPLGNGRRYSTHVRAEICAAAFAQRKAGEKWGAIAAKMGIPVETLRRFCKAAPRNFVAVKVTSEVQRSALVVVSPNGFRVEGLDVEDAAHLLRRLA